MAKSFTQVTTDTSACPRPFTLPPRRPLKTPITTSYSLEITQPMPPRTKRQRTMSPMYGFMRTVNANSRPSLSLKMAKTSITTPATAPTTTATGKVATNV